MLHQALHLDRVKTQSSRYSFHALRRQDGGAFAHEQHTECREIVRQHAPLAVQNLPAWSDDWQVAHPVAFSLFDVKTMLAICIRQYPTSSPRKVRATAYWKKAIFQPGRRSCSGNRTSIYIKPPGPGIRFARANLPGHLARLHRTLLPPSRRPMSPSDQQGTTESVATQSNYFANYSSPPPRFFQQPSGWW